MYISYWDRKNIRNFPNTVRYRFGLLFDVQGILICLFNHEWYIRLGKGK